MYEPFYGLSAKPFRLTPDSNFLFESASHKRALSYLRYGVYCAEGFVVVVGAPGTGKTTLIKKVLSELPREEVVVAKLVTTQQEADDILRSLAASLGMEFEGLTKAGLLNRIEQFLKEQARQGRRVLLLVDEAQYLTKGALEELRMLTNFQEDERALMQCFLVGQEELKGMLDSPPMEQFRQRVIASCHLSALTGSETVAYIEHRLHHVGWDGQAIFSFGAYELIYRQTGGVPRLINTLCERMLLRGYLEDCQEIDENVALAVIEEMVGELGGAEILDELNDAKEAIRGVRRALRVVDAKGVASTADSEQDSAEVFRFQTISEQALADVGAVGLPQDGGSPLHASPLPAESDHIAPTRTSTGQAKSAVDTAAESMPAEPIERDVAEGVDRSVSYVEAAQPLMERASAVPAPAMPNEPDPTPYFGAQKARAAMPRVDTTYQPPASVPVPVRKEVVSEKPSSLQRLKKQLPNIGIVVVLVGMVAMVLFPDPERPLELESPAVTESVSTPALTHAEPRTPPPKEEEAAAASPSVQPQK